MRNKVKEYVKMLFMRDAKKYILFCVLFVSGAVVAAIFCGNTVPEEEIKSYMQDFLRTSKTLGTDGGKTFLLSMAQYVKFAFYMAIFSVTIIGVPLILGATVFVGFSYGTVFVCMFRIFGIKAILLFLCAILPHVFISLPCCLCLSCACLKNAGQVYRGNIQFSKTILYPMIYCLIFLCAVSVAALIQGFIEPFLLKMIAVQFL